jgi:alpha-methylacyl-CoA racemase
MGPLSGVRIIEMAGIGPGPMAAMMLSDMGALVLRVERQADSGLGIRRPEKYDLLLRGRKALALPQEQGLDRGRARPDREIRRID